MDDILLKSKYSVKKELGLNESKYTELIENTCQKLQTQRNNIYFIPSLDHAFDQRFKGVPSSCLTEISGESGTGKTLFVLQLSKSALLSGKRVLYLCTEDMFCIKRFEQILEVSPLYDNLFIQHLGDLDIQSSFINYHLEHSINRLDIGLVVIDSITANFRVSITSSYNDALQTTGLKLKQLAVKFNIPIVVINQVSANIRKEPMQMFHKHILNDPSLVDLVPALGSAWSNLINNRIFLTKKNRLYIPISCIWPQVFMEYEITEGGFSCLEKQHSLN